MAANALSRGTIDVSVIINSMGMVAEMGRLYCVRHDEVCRRGKVALGNGGVNGVKATGWAPRLVLLFHFRYLVSSLEC
jgi:hypothetical protein